MAQLSVPAVCRTRSSQHGKLHARTQHMTPRVERLRTQSIEAVPTVSTERAELLTEFYKSGETEKCSVPVGRALAFKHLLQHKTVCINDGELIVGERGPAPKATPTYPELCCHSLEDLRIVNSRRRTPFLVNGEASRIYEQEIIPHWEGKTIREKVFAAMDDDWHTAFDAGVFTEFMEQRAPGHAILDDKIYRHGFLDFKRRIIAQREELDGGAPEDIARLEQLKAMEICCDAIIQFANRHAERAEEIAQTEADTQRKTELLAIAEVCRHVPAHAPPACFVPSRGVWCTRGAFAHGGMERWRRRVGGAEAAAEPP
ncbi:MAG: pyruvate formate lyase family protein, partial [Planctomycetota bacterium]|nr:pyruvate formate lyase family protein [Planctomycetota bacterium]